MIQYNQKKLTMAPTVLSDRSGEVIFDAKRDNNGKGISVDKMIKTLKSKLRN